MVEQRILMVSCFLYLGVAQFGSALALGARGPGSKSQHLDHQVAVHKRPGPPQIPLK